MGHFTIINFFLRKLMIVDEIVLTQDKCVFLCFPSEDLDPEDIIVL